MHAVCLSLKKDGPDIVDLLQCQLDTPFPALPPAMVSKSSAPDRGFNSHYFNVSQISGLRTKHRYIFATSTAAVSDEMGNVLLKTIHTTARIIICITQIILCFFLNKLRIEEIARGFEELIYIG